MAECHKVAHQSKQSPLLGFDSAKRIDDFETGKSIIFNSPGGPVTLSNLDWSGTEFTASTSLWDLFFDFQNLSDDAFRRKDELKRAFGNPQEGFLAFSMHVASNPMFMGRKEVVNVLFPGIGWH